MTKVVNLLGIRKKVILFRTKFMGDSIYTVMRELTEEQEKSLDTLESVKIDDNIINKDDIYCYGEFNVDNEEDLNYIKKFNIINLDSENFIHCDYDFKTGEVTITRTLAKTRPTWDSIEWFKYNYLLIGKPKRIIIYKCKKCNL